MPTTLTVAARYKWLAYLEADADEDAEPFRVRVRSNLTYGELEALTWDKDTTDRDLWEVFAPYVVAWNIEGRDAKGKTVAIPPPAEGGPEQFQYIHPGLFASLVRDIRGSSLIPLGRTPKPATASGDAGKSGSGSA